MEKKNPRVCGYSYYKSLDLPIQKNINIINYKTTVNSVIIPTISYSNYNTNLVDIDSIYNPGSFKSLVTQNSGITYGTVYILFPNGKKIQYVAVDGSGLSESQYTNPGYVINQYNSGNLNVINFSGTMTNTDKYNFDGYTAGIWFTLFIYEEYGRVGIFDTNDSVLLSVVNVNFTNAFWNGYYMTYGNSSGSGSITPLTTLDIVGHEMMHGITDLSNGLVYQKESGAINESISDIFGSVLELFYDNKSGKNLFDWDIGEDAFPGALRSMSNPNLYGQPDCYLGTYWFPTSNPSDSGGVHTNSGVGNYLFYILCVATTGTNDFNYNYTTTTVFPVLSLAKLIYYYLTGKTGYRSMASTVSYYTYCNDIIYNAKIFITNNTLNTELNITIDTAIRAVNVKIATDPKPKPKKRIRRPRYVPRRHNRIQRRRRIVQKRYKRRHVPYYPRK